MKGGEKLSKDVTFNAVDVKRINMEEYGEDDYAIASVCFLSTRPNSHGIGISEDVLREYAPSVLGKWITAEVKCGDCTMHVPDQVIVGVVPKNQDVRFVEADDGYLDAYVDCIISKRYAKDYCNVFSEDDPTRAVSIEATFDMIDDDNASAFNIKTITTLGKFVKPSVPNANITFVRFSEDEAETYYSRLQKGDALSNLKQFVEERKKSMAENKYVSHPINTSKDAVYTGDWDGNKAKQDVIKEKNYKSLAPKVCLKLEEGWEDREVTKLGYPVMGLYDGEWRYSTKAIASAQAYAEQNDETEVLNKIKKIKKSLGLDDDSEGKEENMAMEIEFSAVDIGDLWSRLWAIIDETRHWEYGISGIYEEDNKKFAILSDRDKKLYRLDFSLTEDGMTVADEVVEVKQEFTDTDNVKKFAEPENVAEYRFSDDDDEPDMEDMKAKLAKLEADIAERDHIIMDKDAELEELRKFKAEVDEQRKAAMVESIMAECKEYMSAEQFAKTREEGMACKPEELDAWSNRAKAVCFSAVKKSAKKALVETDVWGFAAPINPNKSNGLWD